MARIEADFALPPGFEIGRIEFITPESPEPVELKFERGGDRLKFTVPSFLVYGVARMIEARASR